jgi:hypothetical protein
LYRALDASGPSGIPGVGPGVEPRILTRILARVLARVLAGVLAGILAGILARVQTVCVLCGAVRRVGGLAIAGAGAYCASPASAQARCKKQYQYYRDGLHDLRQS